MKKKRYKTYRKWKSKATRNHVANVRYRGIGLFKYRKSVRSPFMWQSDDPFKACPVMSVFAWHKMRKSVTFNISSRINYNLKKQN